MAEWTEVGAGWDKKGKGGDFISLSFTINGVKYSANLFRNTKKEKENQPDYRMSMRTEAAEPQF